MIAEQLTYRQAMDFTIAVQMRGFSLEVAARRRYPGAATFKACRMPRLCRKAFAGGIPREA